jgi:hypothetical protein
VPGHQYSYAYCSQEFARKRRARVMQEAAQHYFRSRPEAAEDGRFSPDENVSGRFFYAVFHAYTILYKNVSAIGAVLALTAQQKRSLFLIKWYHSMDFTGNNGVFYVSQKNNAE